MQWKGVIAVTVFQQESNGFCWMQIGLKLIVTVLVNFSKINATCKYTCVSRNWMVSSPGLNGCVYVYLRQKCISCVQRYKGNSWLLHEFDYISGLSMTAAQIWAIATSGLREGTSGEQWLEWHAVFVVPGSCFTHPETWRTVRDPQRHKQETFHLRQVNMAMKNVYKMFT